MGLTDKMFNPVLVVIEFTAAVIASFVAGREHVCSVDW